MVSARSGGESLRLAMLLVRRGTGRDEGMLELVPPGESYILRWSPTRGVFEKVLDSAGSTGPPLGQVDSLIGIVKLVKGTNTHQL